MRHEREEELNDRLEPAMEAQATANPESRAASTELGAGITDCLGGLVPPRKAAVTLYLQGHTVPETARVLNWTQTKAKNLVFRGLENMRRCLTGKGFAP